MVLQNASAVMHKDNSMVSTGLLKQVSGKDVGRYKSGEGYNTKALKTLVKLILKR